MTAKPRDHQKATKSSRDTLSRSRRPEPGAGSESEPPSEVFFVEHGVYKKVHSSPRRPTDSTLPHSSQGRIQKVCPGLTSPPKAVSLPGTTGHPRPVQPRVLFSLKCWWILESQVPSRSEPWLCCHLCPEFFLCLYDGHSYSFSWVPLGRGSVY